MTEHEIRTMVKKRKAACVSQGKLARELGVSQANLSLFLHGRTGPSEALLKGLGLMKVVDYRPIAEAQPVEPPKEPPRKRMWSYGDWPAKGVQP